MRSKKNLLLMAFALCQMLISHDALAQSNSKSNDYLFYLTPSDVTVRESMMPGTYPNGWDVIERQQLPENENYVLNRNYWRNNTYSHPTGFLAMAKNEREGFNVFYREKGTSRNIKVIVSSFVNSSGDELAHNLYYEEFFNPGDNSDSIADALVPYNGKLVRTASNHNRVFYVEFKSEKDQTSGLYTGTVKLYKNNVLLESKTVTVRVWDFILPEQHYADAMVGLYNRNSGYNNTYYFLKQSGIDVDSNGNIPTQQLETAKNIIKIYQEFLLNHGISTFEIPRWLIDDDSKAAELTMADPRRKWFTVPVNNDDFNNGDLTTEGQSILNKYKDLVYENVLLKDKAFFYPMDEPNWNNNTTGLFNQIVNKLNDVWPGYHAVVPFNKDYETSVGNFENTIDILCPKQDFFNGGNNNGNVNVANANLNDFKGHEYTWRFPGDNQCGGVYLRINDLLSSGVMRRILFWQQYALGSEGILFWNCAYYPDNIWSTKKLSKNGLRNCNGDGILIYPSRTISQNEYTPIASLRLKQFADGIEDYDYLKLLKEFVGESAAQTKLKEIISKDNPLCYMINRHRESYCSYTCMCMFQTRYSIGEALSSKNTEHNWGEWEVVVEADETHDGLEIRTCLDCGTQESRTFEYSGGTGFVFVGTVNNKWTNLDNWQGNPSNLPSYDDDVTINAECVLNLAAATVKTLSFGPAGKLTLTNYCEFTVVDEVGQHTANQLVMEDGTQFYNPTPNTKVTFKKAVKGRCYGGITSPIIEGTNRSIFMSGSYTMQYYVPQENRWDRNIPILIKYDKGYQYYNKNSYQKTFTMTGEVRAWDEYVSQSVYNRTGSYWGWNFVGNPFANTIDIYDVTNNGMQITAYQILGSNGRFVTYVGSSGPGIKPGEGFMIYCRKGTIEYNTNNRHDAADESYIRVLLSVNDSIIDRAYLKLDGEVNMPKLPPLNDNVTSMYFVNNDTCWAIASFDKYMEEIPLYLESDTTCTMTISVDMLNLSCEYLHIIDLKENKNCDLSERGGKYTFKTNAGDAKDRFKLRFTVSNNGIEETDETAYNFAYYYNNSLLIPGIEEAADMRIIDMLGRVLYTETISGDYARELNLATGVYIVTVGDKAQKIVVR